MDRTTALLPQIHSRDGWVFATSRDVAAYFEKQVKHVHEAIRTIIKHEPSTRSNFRPFEIKDLTGVSVHHYEMDRKGFTLLAMGFTGRKALKFKLAYLAAFNEVMERLQAMENATVSSAPSNYVDALRCALGEAEKREALASLTPTQKAPLVDDLAAAARAWADAYERRQDGGRSQRS